MMDRRTKSKKPMCENLDEPKLENEVHNISWMPVIAMGLNHTEILNSNNFHA